MNSSLLGFESFLCQVFQDDVEDKKYIISSISLLTVIGVLGFVGNILVLLVYCQSPRSNCSCYCCCCQSLQVASPRFRKGLRHSQRKLLIALAVVDLLTSCIILPCDVGHKLFILLNIRIYCDINLNNFAYGIIDNARNIMFALEGSILTSIAIDRFLVLGCPYVKNIGSRWRARASSASEISSGQASSADVLSKTQSNPTGESENNFASSATDIEASRRSERLTEIVVPHSISKLRRQLCVILPITFTTLIVMLFEIVVFVLHVREHNMSDTSLPAARLRHFLNRVYLISTIVAFPLVCGPYICVFLAIRNYDKKRARLHRSGSNLPSRSWRTALTLFIATLVFYLTLLPVLIVHFSNWSTDSGTKEDLAKDVHIHSSAVYIHHEFYYFNNAVNFFIYSWVSPAFRRRLKDLFKSK